LDTNIILDDKIITNLLFNTDYARKVIPFLKTDYFEGERKIIVDEIIKFYGKYSDIPTKDALLIELERRRGINESTMRTLKEYVASYTKDNSNYDWLVKSTERFCQDRAMCNAIVHGAEMLNAHSEDLNGIYRMVTDALAVSFESDIGHDYFNDIDKRYELYHQSEDKISWGIESLDRITNGGMSKKNLLCCIAPTGSGKSLFMCAIASNCVRLGYNVLYVSLEMSEQRVAERIDANFMGERINKIQNMELTDYKNRCEKLKAKARGRLIIKEFPTSGANVNHFKSLLNDLRLKKNFVPDLIVVDYLNICSSARIKAGQTNSYGFIKAISEELRGLAVEQNVAILTATQVNRQGFESSDIDMSNVSESFGLTYVLDMFFALIRTPALDELNQISIKQLKNRYSDPTEEPQLTLGINRDHMMIYDIGGAENMFKSRSTGANGYMKPVMNRLNRSTVHMETDSVVKEPEFEESTTTASTNNNKFDGFIF